MSKHFVVSVRRDRYFQPKLTIVVEARVSSAAAGERFITRLIMEAYAKRSGKKFGRFASMRVFNYRIVDEQGLKRLYAAAKASVTLRRKRAAKKAAETRRKNAVARASHIIEPRDYYPAH